MDKIRKLFHKEPKNITYPRTYPTNQLEREIDKLGGESPHSHLGPSYYTRAALGLTELERRSTKIMGWLTLGISTLALIFSFLAVQYAAEQTQYTELESRSARIAQLQNIQKAVERCKASPDLLESGLFDASDGRSVSCKYVLSIYKN